MAVRCLVEFAVAWMVGGIVLGGVTRAQTADDPAALEVEGLRLYHAGKYAEASAIGRRLLTIREKALGPGHPEVAKALNNLAVVYQEQSRYAEAEPLYRRSLAIWETTLGPQHPSTASALSNLAGLSVTRVATQRPSRSSSAALPSARTH